MVVGKKERSPTNTQISRAAAAAAGELFVFLVEIDIYLGERAGWAWLGGLAATFHSSQLLKDFHQGGKTNE